MRQLLLQQDDPNFKDIEDFLSLLEGKSTTPKEKCMKCEGWSEFLHLTPQRQNAFKPGFFLSTFLLSSSLLDGIIPQLCWNAIWNPDSIPEDEIGLIRLEASCRKEIGS